MSLSGVLKILDSDIVPLTPITVAKKRIKMAIDILPIYCRSSTLAAVTAIYGTPSEYAEKMRKFRANGVDLPLAPSHRNLLLSLALGLASIIH